MSGANTPGSSIRRRLLLFLFPTLTLLMLGAAIVEYRTALLFARRVVDQRLLDAAGLVAGRLLQAPQATACPASQELVGDTTPIHCSVTDLDGALLAGRAGLRIPQPLGANNSVADGMLDGRAVRIATVRLATPSGLRIINVATDLQAYRRPVALILSGTWLIGFIQLDMTLLIVWVGVYYGLKPLLAVRSEIESRSPRDLQPLTERSVPAEIRPLVSALNQLFEMLTDSVGAQRRFVADTAHQLRTPLAGLLGNLELLMRDPLAGPVAPRLGQLHAGLEKLSHTANQLLALARADSTGRIGDFRALRLDTLAARLVESQLDRAIGRGIDLGAECQPVELPGDERLLEDLLSNLLDNALKYTVSPGHVTVRCGERSGLPFLEVEDDGPGIPEGERNRVRERFYRAPGSSAEGSGLGLAIADEIARVHGARLELGSGAAGRGLRVTLEFPSQPRTGAARGAHAVTVPASLHPRQLRDSQEA